MFFLVPRTVAHGVKLFFPFLTVLGSGAKVLPHISSSLHLVFWRQVVRILTWTLPYSSPSCCSTSWLISQLPTLECFLPSVCLSPTVSLPIIQPTNKWLDPQKQCLLEGTTVWFCCLCHPADRTALRQVLILPPSFSQKSNSCLSPLLGPVHPLASSGH